MTKTEFLEYLEKRLQVLNKKEREDILSEYAQHIELKMESGLSEEEAIHDFGDLEELTAEILDAYNVNPEYQKSPLHRNKEKLSIEAAKVGNKIDVLRKRWKAAGRNLFHDRTMRIPILLKCFLVLLILFIIYLPLLMVDLFIGDVLYSVLPSPLDGLAECGVVLGFHLLYLLFTISSLYTFIKNNQSGEPNEEEAPSARGQGFDLRTKVQKLLTLPGFSRKDRMKKPQRAGSYIRFLWCLIKASVLFLFRGTVICFLMPVLLFLLFLVIIFGNLMVMAVLGYPVIGLTILLSGGLLCGFTFIWFILSLLFTRKERKEA